MKTKYKYIASYVVDNHKYQELIANLDELKHLFKLIEDFSNLIHQEIRIYVRMI